jgi:LPXTG-motif cell wall-anchored protein
MINYLRRWAPFPVAMMIMVSALLYTGAPPAAADDGVRVSPDGRSWTPGSTQPLFDADERWVPGDARERSFWVKNIAETSATLTITIDAPVDPRAATPMLRFAARGSSGDWVRIEQLGRPQPLAVELTPEEEIRLFVRVRFPPEAGNDSQGASTPLSITVTLTDRSADPGGDLPDTGAPRLWMLPLGAAFLGLAAALFARRPRHRRVDHG